METSIHRQLTSGFGKGYSPQRSGEFQLDGEEGSRLCPDSGGTQGRQRILQ